MILAQGMNCEGAGPQWGVLIAYDRARKPKVQTGWMEAQEWGSKMVANG